MLRAFPNVYSRRFHPSSREHVQLAQNVSTGSAAVASTPEQLRETLKKTTVPDLIEKCKAAGISGYSNKRREELIDLLVRKRPRLDDQVHSAGVGRYRPARLCGLRSVPHALVLRCVSTGTLVTSCRRVRRRHLLHHLLLMWTRRNRRYSSRACRHRLHLHYCQLLVKCCTWGLRHVACRWHGTGG